MSVTPKRLLIVDDETEIRSTLAAFFTSIGYEVQTASDGTDALAKIARGYDAVLCDISMPGGGGIEFLEKARRTIPGLAVFLITGYPSLESVIDARRFGVTAYFPKPLNLQELGSCIRACIGEEDSRLQSPATSC